MQGLITIRASALPRAFACAASARQPTLRIETDSDPARLGTAAHALLEAVVNQALTHTGGLDIEAAAKQDNVDVDDLRFLVLSGIKLWGQIKAWFPGALAEFDLEGVVNGVRVTGHPDVMAISGTKATVGDWKSGRVDYDYRQQMRGYMALIMLNFPEVKEVVGIVGWLREQEIEPYRMSRADLPAWLAEFDTNVAQWDGQTYNVGSACTYCPRTHECPALAATVRRDIAMLADDSMAARIESGLADLKPAQIVDYYRKAKRIEKFTESFRQAVRARAIAEGSIPDDDGRELRLTESHPRYVDPMAAWPVLHRHLTDEEIAGAVKLSASKLDDAVAKKAGRGKGAEAKRQLAAALEEAGAVRTETQYRLTDARKKADGEE